jgi:hypothetical protein
MILHSNLRTVNRIRRYSSAMDLLPEKELGQKLEPG